MWNGILTGFLTKHGTEGYCALKSVPGRFLAFAQADRILIRVIYRKSSRLHSLSVEHVPNLRALHAWNTGLLWQGVDCPSDILV